MNSKRPVAIDLFGGVGGMALGFEQAGFDVVCAVEFDRAHAAAHRFNFPLCEVLEVDASKLSVAELKRGIERGLSRHGRENQAVDVVFGGPPCQGFSVGGIGDPTDPRNELVEDFVRLVRGIKPRAFVLENVPAMASRTLPTSRETIPNWVSSSLEQWYKVPEHEILNSNSFGVPQDRRRLVLWGARKSEPDLSTPEATYRPRPKVPSGNSTGESDLPLGPSVNDAIGDLPNLDHFEELLTSDTVKLPGPLASAVEALASPYAARLASSTRELDDYSRSRKHERTALASSLRTTHSPSVIERFSAVRQGESDPISRFYRLHPDGISCTLRAGSTPDRGSYSAPRPIHPMHPRVISVREAARLHGYPDWFRFTAAKWHGFRQVGNSVCPPLARRLGEALRNALELPAVRVTSTLALGDPALLKVASGAGRRPGTRFTPSEPQLDAEESAAA
jgi:DNA (cytosine-5)-methyltransferase 1